MGPKVTIDWQTSNETIKKFNLSKDDVKTVELIGTCAAMSINWARRVLEKGKKLDQDVGLQTHIAESAQYQKVKWDFEKDASNWHERFFELNNLKGEVVAQGKGSDINPTSDDGTYVFSIYGTYNGAKVGHTMAFRRDDDASSFYDPNTGQWSVEKSVFSNFKDFVNGQISSLYPFQGLYWFVYRVKLQGA